MPDLNQPLSKNFLLRELLVSDYAVRKNISEQFTPDVAIIKNLTALCDKVLQPLREQLRLSVSVTSGYRCPKVNKGIGGALTSQHQFGEAADIHVSGKSIEWLFQFIIKAGLPFDQIIQEFDNWVHISYKSTKNRREILQKKKKRKKVIYTKVN